MNSLCRFSRACTLFALVFAGTVPAAFPQKAFVPRTSEEEAVIRKAIALRNDQRLLEAEGVLQEALHENPGSAAYHFEMANLYALRHDRLQKGGRADKARQVLERVSRELRQVLMLDPRLLPALYNLGVTYKRLGESEKAREIFRQVLSLADSAEEAGVRFNALMQIGSVYEEQGFFEDARDYYLKAKDHDYFNQNVDAALEDLERRREESRRNAVRRHAAERLSPWGRDFGFTPHSHAASQNDIRQSNLESSQGIAQAIPYLSMMLVQQFLNREGSMKDDFWFPDSE